MLSSTAKARLARIKEWANDNYDKGGSFIIETMNDADILAEFRTITSAKDFARTKFEMEQEVLSA